MTNGFIDESNFDLKARWEGMLCSPPYWAARYSYIE